MSFYRSILAAVAAAALVAPVFAEETTGSTTGTSTDTTMTQSTASTEDTTTTTTTSTEETKVDINKATKKELSKVKGITPSKAKAIVDYRKKNGDFKTLDDLTKVSGFKKMNEETLKGIQDHLTVE